MTGHTPRRAWADARGYVAECTCGTTLVGDTRAERDEAFADHARAGSRKSPRRQHPNSRSTRQTRQHGRTTPR